MSLLRNLLAVSLVAGLASAAQAGKPAAAAGAVKPARPDAAAAAAGAAVAVAPVFECWVKPVPPPAAQDLFQVTTVKLTLKSGTLPKGKKAAVRLGIQPTGNVLTTFCTDGFGASKTAEQTAVTVAPPIMDPNYIWQCNAKMTADPCDPPPAIPR